MEIIKKIYIIFIVIIWGIFIMPVAKVNARPNLQETDAGGNPDTVSGIIGIIRIDEPLDSDMSEIKTLVGSILGFLQVIAGLILVVTIAYMGFEMIFDKDVSAKERLKTKMIPLVVGTVLVFGAVTIANFILSITA